MSNNYCLLNDAFEGKPYNKTMPHLFKSYNTANKKNLFKEHKQIKVHNNRLIKHYESPLTQLSDNSFIEGKWRDHPQLENKPGTPAVYPYPHCNNKSFFDNNFINKLDNIIENNKRYAIPYNNLEVCRLCYKTLGNMEYTIQNSNVTFRFGCGLVHYYKEHNVWPSKMFYQFISNMK